MYSKDYYTPTNNSNVVVIKTIFGSLGVVLPNHLSPCPNFL